MDNKPFERLLNLTCDVYRKTPSRNAHGELVADEATEHATGVPCFAGNPTGRMVNMPAGLNPILTKLFFFMPDQDVKENDVLAFDGRRYLVHYVQMAHDIQDTQGSSQPAQTAHHLEAYAETIIGG